ncbi:MFS transporter [Saccharopolyspora pogona]|uniref:MFS transporter n=1 Tax=Saccharopolyspora pogona TaxID=333966 RepID=UPI001684C058|nr:MFS transporter [Saccharopolyspora pogona]
MGTTVTPDMARPRGAARMARKALAAGTVGNFVEWYEWAIYGFSAPIIATLFFPKVDTTAALLATFGIYGVGFLVRPLGGFFFGHLGDKIGRRNVLSAVLLLMGAGTTIIGLLPVYGQIGLLAPLLLLVARLIQGFSAGGEFPGANSFILEYAPAERRGFWAAISLSSTVLPTIVGALTVMAFTSLLSPDAYATWGWRVPYLIAAPMAIVGLWIRLKMEDTPAYREVAATDTVEKLPLVRAIKEYPKEIAYALAFSTLTGVVFYIVSGYFVTFLTINVGIPQTTALLSTVVAYSLFLIAAPVFGLLSDRVGRKPVLYLGSATLAVLSVPAFFITQGASLGSAILGQALLVLGLSITGAGMAVTQAEMFPTRVRYSGASFAYNIAYAVFGGTAPMMCAFLIAQSGSKLAPGIYIAVLAVVVFFFVRAAPETYKVSLSQGPERRRRSGDADGQDAATF